jgi:phenylalanyl-tRNA synthetase beta chain
MKISLDWLKDFIELKESPEAIADLLTQSGLEVEGLEQVESIKGGLAGLVIGEVMTCEKHPNADKLSVTTVDIGANELSPIVCGAPNVAKGQKVVVATVGSTLYPSSGEPFKIKKAKIRGEVSEGMICAEDEIGLGEHHDGIMVLDTDVANGTAAADFFNLSNDEVLEIGLTPNRADGASHLGTARDLKALLGRDIKMPNLSTFSVDDTSRPIKVTVEDLEACPRYSSITITNVEVKPSPEWLQRRLKSIGINPTNNVVDSTNYVLHGLGQPMHAFDADAIKGDHVIVKTMPKGTSFTTLDDVERKLSETDLMICNAKEPMCIGGVFGGIKSGVTEKTKNVFLEVAYFSPDSIRRTALHHQLKTDASFRYERGTDPNMTVTALKYASILIKELTGGNISSEINDIYPKAMEDFKVEVKYKHIDRLIGMNIPTEKVRDILNSLDIRIEPINEESFLAIVPPYRVDVRREADVIEEILRIYGYNKVPLADHLSSTFLSHFPKKSDDLLQLEISRLLSGAGYHEMVTNSLTKRSYSESVEVINSEEDVLILNSLSEDLNVMRQTMLFHGLEVVERNVNRRQTDLSLYEFGTTYHLIDGKYKERAVLAMFLTGQNHQEHWIEKGRATTYHDMAQVVYQILSKFKIDRLVQEASTSDIFDYGLQISLNKKVLVEMGKVAEKLTKNAKVSQEVFYAQIDWDYLKKQYPLNPAFEPISKFPEVKRDLSLVVDKSVKFDEISSLARKLERQLITKINVFDVYEGDKIEENQKAYAVSFFLQDQEKTLTDKLIDKTMNKLISGFERELGAIIRK